MRVFHGGYFLHYGWRVRNGYGGKGGHQREKEKGAAV